MNAEAAARAAHQLPGPGTSPGSGALPEAAQQPPPHQTPAAPSPGLARQQEPTFQAAAAQPPIVVQQPPPAHPTPQGAPAPAAAPAARQSAVPHLQRVPLKLSPTHQVAADQGAPMSGVAVAQTGILAQHPLTQAGSPSNPHEDLAPPSALGPILAPVFPQS